MKIKTILLFLFAYQFVSGQNCEVFMQKFQKEYQRKERTISYGGFDKTKFNEAKVHITRFINCKADEIGYENEVLTKLKNCIDLIYREDTNLIIAGEYDEKKSLKLSEYPNRYYIINSKLEIINDYDEIRNYSYFGDDYNKEIYYVIKNNKYGIIDKYGKEIVNPAYDEIYWFKDGRAVVKNMKKFGAVDISGKLVIPLEYDSNGYHYEFSDGYLTVVKGEYPNQKFGLVDKNGVEVIKPQYEYALKYFGGLLPVRKDEKMGFVNIKNEVVIPFKYDVVGGRDNYWKGYNSKGVWYYLVQKKWDGKEEYINKKGEIFKRREDVKD